MPPQTQDTTEPYSWGKMGPGRRWHKVASDLDRAWAVCRMTVAERVLLQYVREHTWGAVRKDDVEPSPCPINVSALASACGLNRQRLAEGLASLVTDGLLAASGGCFAIVKDASSWKGDRIDAVALAYAAGGLGRPASSGRIYRHEPRPATVRISGRWVSGFPDDGPAALSGFPDGDCPEIRTVSVRKSGQSGPAAYRNAGASEDLEIKEDNQERGREGSLDPITEPTKADPLPPNLPVAAPPSPDPEEVRLAEWVGALVLRKTEDAALAAEFRASVSYWREVQQFPRHHVAAIVAEFYGWKARQIDPKHHVGYVRAIFNGRKTDQDPGAVPPEWKPRPPAVEYVPTSTPEERRAYAEKLRATKERVARERVEAAEEARRKDEEKASPAYREFAEAMRLRELARRQALIRGLAS